MTTCFLRGANAPRLLKSMDAKETHDTIQWLVISGAVVSFITGLFILWRMVTQHIKDNALINNRIFNLEQWRDEHEKTDAEIKEKLNFIETEVVQTREKLAELIGYLKGSERVQSNFQAPSPQK